MRRDQAPGEFITKIAIDDLRQTIRSEEDAQQKELDLSAEARNNLRFWQSLGISVDEQDVVHQFEFHHQKFSEGTHGPESLEKRKRLLYVPPITIARIVPMYGDQLGIIDNFGFTAEDILQLSSESDTTSYAMEFYLQREPDQLPDRQIGETASPQEWQSEVSGYYRGAMDLKERLIVGLMYQQTHNGRTMDVYHKTFCPTTLLSEMHCVEVAFGTKKGSRKKRTYISACPINLTNKYAGVRETTRTNVHLQE